LEFMPRRDLQLLFSDTRIFIDYLFEHIRFALQTFPFSNKFGVTWENFLDNVLPYAVLDEKRDLWWRWRPKFYQLFWGLVQTASTLTEAVHILVDAIPQAQAQDTLAFSDANTVSTRFEPGLPISWKSETSPGHMSPQQVIELAGSCTGTGIVMVAVCRSVGVPARLAGCPESIARGDDHHWVEYWDASNPGPFKDNWHTKEGVSRGNEGGPWDSPSGPMAGCLAGVVPGSAMDSLWTGAWSSLSYYPSLWANSTWFETWSYVGGINRCGAYCTAWGCGTNHANHWNQSQCAPKQKKAK